MRASTMIAALGGAGLLAAGSTAGSFAPEGPSITLRYHDAGVFPQMMKIAGRYCAKDHGLQARLNEQRPAGEGYLATFTCERS